MIRDPLVPEEVVAEFAKRRGMRNIDDARDYIRLHLLEAAQRLVGVPLIDALEVVSIVRRSTQEEDFRGRASESHLCVDCGFDTAPGLLDRRAMEEAAKALGDAWTKMDQGIPQHIDQNSEVYRVRDSVWKKAGMTPWGGCLCVGCLEARIGRRLKPKDFDRYHPFNDIPGTKRLLSRRDG